MTTDRRLRKCERLRLRVDFARVFARRCSAADPVLVVYVATNDLGYVRIGLSVSRRVGNAVVRNRVRRRIREAFRRHKASLPVGLDIICVARPKAACDDADIANSVRVLVARAARKVAATC